MHKLIAKLIGKATSGAHSILSLFVSKRRLSEWKPIHLCWWFNKHHMEIPRHFVGTTEQILTGVEASCSVVASAGTYVANELITEHDSQIDVDVNVIFGGVESASAVVASAGALEAGCLGVESASAVASSAGIYVANELITEHDTLINTNINVIFGGAASVCPVISGAGLFEVGCTGVGSVCPVLANAGVAGVVFEGAGSVCPVLASAGVGGVVLEGAGSSCAVSSSSGWLIVANFICNLSINQISDTYNLTKLTEDLNTGLPVDNYQIRRSCDG